MKFIYTKAFILFTVFLIVITALLFFETRGYLEPLRYALLQAPRPVNAVVSGVTVPLKNFFSTIFALKGIASENAELTGKVQNLQQQLVLMDQYKQENEVLKKELNFVDKSPLSLQPCTVLATDPQGISDTIVTSCGEGEGIREGEAVISQGYLVGKIIHVGKLTSTALLITATDSSIDSKLSKSGVQGVVRGSFGSGLALDLIPQTTDVSKGELLITGGINTVIPKNILIGETGDILTKGNELFKKITIISPIDFRNLHFVFIAK